MVELQQQEQEATVSVRDNEPGLVFYKGVGTAIMDVILAHAVVQRAKELQIGLQVDME